MRVYGFHHWSRVTLVLPKSKVFHFILKKHASFFSNVVESLWVSDHVTIWCHDERRPSSQIAWLVPVQNRFWSIPWCISMQLVLPSVHQGGFCYICTASMGLVSTCVVVPLQNVFFTLNHPVINNNTMAWHWSPSQPREKRSLKKWSTCPLVHFSDMMG